MVLFDFILFTVCWDVYSVSLCLLWNLMSFQPLFPHFFLHQYLSPLLWDANYTSFRSSDNCVTFFQDSFFFQLFSPCFADWTVSEIYLPVYWLFPLLHFAKVLILDIIFFSLNVLFLKIISIFLLRPTFPSISRMFSFPSWNTVITVSFFDNFNIWTILLLTFVDYLYL